MLNLLIFDIITELIPCPWANQSNTEAWFPKSKPHKEKSDQKPWLVQKPRACCMVSDTVPCAKANLSLGTSSSHLQQEAIYHHLPIQFRKFHLSWLPQELQNLSESTVLRSLTLSITASIGFLCDARQVLLAAAMGDQVCRTRRVPSSMPLQDLRGFWEKMG